MTPASRASPAQPAGTRPRQLPYRALLCLGGLVVCYLVASAWRYLPPTLGARATNPLPGVQGLALANPDLKRTRANPTLGQPKSPFRFTEVTREAGIDFVHVSGMTDAKHFPTAYGSGVAIFDFDNDGRLDLYFATATRLPPGTARTGPNRLFRNLGNNRYQEATQTSGLGYRGFCQAIVVGDIDNDGDQDVFLCNYGANVLYLNRGNGTFEDISKRARIDRPGWSTAGAFLDYDNDGDLDLYVVNYGYWKLPDDDRECTVHHLWRASGTDKVRVYCSPKSIAPARHTLYRNNGDLSFTDVTSEAGLARSDGRGLGVVTADLNNDGAIDIYVANDMCPNFLFLNRGDGTFQDLTDRSGAGYDPHGQARAGMGVDAEDVDGDGLPDLFVTNFWNEGNALFKNLGDGLFHERTKASGLWHDSLPWVGWGCALVDFDRDGWPDCFAANGHVDNNLHLAGHSNPYAEPALLHRNLGGGRFQLATREAGRYFDDFDHVGRGVAFGDLDDDGDIDLVISHMDAPPAILRNDTQTENHWIGLLLVGTRSNRDAVGARIELALADRTIVRQRKGGTSFRSAHDPRLFIGLGAENRVRAITVRWPSGKVDQHRDLRVDTRYRFVEGAGIDVISPR